MIEYLKSGEDLSKLGLIKERLLSSNYTVALTGAGMSIESGVPDFITPKVGLYDSSSFITYSYPKTIRENPYKFGKFYRECLTELDRLKPNPGHEILSKWEKQGLIRTVITQSLEEFHRMAGSRNVIEMHGSMRKIHCNDCGKKFTIDEYLSQNKALCDCGGVIRPSIVLYTESIMDIQSVYKEIKKADLLLVLGTSIRSFPASELPVKGGRRSTGVIIINNKTALGDKCADILINGRNIGETLVEIDRQIENSY